MRAWDKKREEVKVEDVDIKSKSILEKPIYMITKATSFFDVLVENYSPYYVQIYYEKLVVVHCSRAPKKFEDTGLLKFFDF